MAYRSVVAGMYLAYNAVLLAAAALYATGNEAAAIKCVLAVVLLHFGAGGLSLAIEGRKAAVERFNVGGKMQFRHAMAAMTDAVLLPAVCVACVVLLQRPRHGAAVFGGALTAAVASNWVCSLLYFYGPRSSGHVDAHRSCPGAC